jgi:uncharacterized RmlC-like cupin family protein
MEHVPEIGRYGTYSNPAQLRVVTKELLNLAVDIDRTIATATEAPTAHVERIAGLEEVKSLIMDGLLCAKHRLDQLSTQQPAREPIVIDPAALPSIQSPQGQPVSPIVSRPAVATEGISSAEVWMPPGHAAFAHVHHETDIIVLVRDGEAVTLWWDTHGSVHEVRQRAGQHLHIPHGVPHAALNLGARPVVATEFRSNPEFNADNHRLPHLEPIVTARLEPVLDEAA